LDSKLEDKRLPVILHYLITELGHEVSIRQRLSGWSCKILC